MPAHKASRLSVLHLSLGLAYATPALAFTPLGDLPGGAFDSRANAVSGDGTTVVGFSASSNGAQDAFRWTQAGGMVSLGDLAGGTYQSLAFGVNGDGSVVVGRSNSAGGDQAFRWTQAGGMVGLGGLPGGALDSSATGVSADGSVIVGISNSTSGYQAFRWTQAGGMVGLGDLPGGIFYSQANATNGDGSVVVGISEGFAGNYAAFRWTQAGGMIALGDLAGGSSLSNATGVSRDGLVVVGYSDSANGNEAFRWTQAGGMVGLGDLAGGTFYSLAAATNADGSVVVGSSVSGSGSEAFRWTQATGMQSVAAWLTANGVAIAPGYSMWNASGVSDDGSVVVGLATRPGGGTEAYLARVAGSGSGGGGSGSISLSAYQQSLFESSRASAMAQRSANLVFHGAHGRPLARRAMEGASVFWLAGDWGTDDHQSRNGDLGLAEVGVGRTFGSVQVNASLGQTWARQNLSVNGTTRVDGTYLMAEALVPLDGNLWGSFAAYGLWGNADLRRGYLNAGLPDASTANPDTSAWGLRARLDWDNAFVFGASSVTPHLDLSHIEARTAGYTETSGGFPAHFDSRTERATELRLGANASYPLDHDVRLIGMAEIAHRFQDQYANTRGQVVGLFSFNLTGEPVKQTWLRAGIGVEGKLGGGTASLMLNATTEGSAPSAWIAANYQLPF